MTLKPVSGRATSGNGLGVGLAVVVVGFHSTYAPLSVVPVESGLAGAAVGAATAGR